MLKIEDLHVYYGAIHAIKGVSFEVANYCSNKLETRKRLKEKSAEIDKKLGDFIREQSMEYEYKTYFKAHYGVNCEFSVDGEFEDVYVLSVVNK